MANYRVLFPRWQEDIVTRKRTLLHLPCCADIPTLVKGDRLFIVAHPVRAGEVVFAEVTEVTQVTLFDSLDAAAEWDRLNLPSRDSERTASCLAYSLRWNEANPDVPWVSKPTVWRIVFRYLETPPQFGQAV